MSNEKIMIGAMTLADAQRVAGRLAAAGIDVQVAVPPKSCASGGCSPKAELWAHPDDLPGIQSFFTEAQSKMYEGLTVDHGLLGQVFDPSQSEATCPACGTRFATARGECPECGLCFGVQDSGGCR